MNNLPPNKARRLVFMLSGAIDAVIGGILLLIGFSVLPLDVAQYGVQNWHVNVLGGAMFLLGAVTFAYNLSRLEE
jgi:branched-subunit amino acid ABC-type transport system permease component